LNGSLVIDVSHINYVDVSEDLTTATIGAGANLGQIYTALSVYGKTFLGGICPSVALGGYIGIGGYNLQQRKLGLAVDQILSFKLLTASGELLTVAPTQHPELWWAARGGGTFGIIVETTVKILTLPRSAMVKIPGLVTPTSPRVHFPAQSLQQPSKFHRLVPWWYSRTVAERYG
jgi:FAD/FMN-containing dehydrogenase